MTDVGLKEEVSYYEYTNKSDKEKVLSIEKWKDEIEVSRGKINSCKSFINFLFVIRNKKVLT